MKKTLVTVVLTAALAALLSGCLFRGSDDLYALPQRSPGYENLTAKMDEVKRNLELEYGTTVEYAVIYSGDNTSTVQFQDMDGDGQRETAVTFFRVPGVDSSLRIYFLTLQGDGETYEVSAVVQGEGAGIFAIDYVQLSGEGQKEVVVSWRTSDGVYQLGAYCLDQPDQIGTSPVAAELLMTTYTNYSLLDINRDTNTEIAVSRVDPAGNNSSVEIYGWRDGTLGSLGAANLSAGITSLDRVRINYLKDAVPALYITSTLADGGRAIDIVTMRMGETVNLALDHKTGLSREIIRGYGNLNLSDVNSDSVLELPSPHLLPAFGENPTSDFWLIDWSQYSISGEKLPIFTTYHNISDSWYLVIPDSWTDQITIARDDRISGERAVIFSRWNGPDDDPTPFLAIYKLTGVNRAARATRGSRFVLAEDSSTIYAAAFYDSGWDCGLDETSLRDNFHLILANWAND